jgi:hypothetical protein
VTCWRRLRDWQEAGVWERLHRALLDRLGEADQIDWSRASLDSASIPAKKGATSSVPTRRIAARPRGCPARSAMLWSSAATSPRQTARRLIGHATPDRTYPQDRIKAAQVAAHLLSMFLVRNCTCD